MGVNHGIFVGNSTAGMGTVGGSTGSTDNRLLRADGTGGSTLQNSAITCDDSGNLTGVGTVNGVKKYVALLTQTGTNAPVATVLENTLGGTVVWSYLGIGTYLGTLAGAFPANKTTPWSAGIDWISNLAAQGYRATNDTYTVKSGGINDSPADDALSGTLCVIAVYP